MKHEIATVYHFGNGMVMVFDQFGDQMSEYQGRYEDVIGKIKEVYRGPIILAHWIERSE